jgi:aminomethyltransferase
MSALASTFLLNEAGGIIDDLIVYRIEEQKFLLVVNASRTDEDFAWLDRHRPKHVALTNRSADLAESHSRAVCRGPLSRVVR